MYLGLAFLAFIAASVSKYPYQEFLFNVMSVMLGVAAVIDGSRPFIDGMKSKMLKR